MMYSRRAALFGAAIATPLVLCGLPAQAQQDYPARDIHVICGYAAGTGADILVRFYADKLKPFVGGRSLIVENKAGAFTAIAAEGVARARPDGYTLFITAGNSTMAGNPHTMKKLPYDPIKDFSPVTTLNSLPFLLVVKPDSPIKSMPDLIAHLKAKGDKASYGYPNTFSLAAGELFKNLSGTNSVQVAYKSTPEALTDLLGNQLDYLWSDATFGLGQIKAGRMRGLAVTSGKRSTIAPDLPSLDEAGLKGYDLTAWWGAWYPANTPKPIVDKMAGWLNQILAAQDTKDTLRNQHGVEAFPGSPDQLAKLTVNEIKKWGEVFKLAKVEPQ